MLMWNNPAFDDHEKVTLIHDVRSGLAAVIALHSTHLGPGAGGTRFWHYPDRDDAVTDALRLSQGMSYKNAMADLPMGGGKAVIIADAQATKTPEMLAAFGKAVEALGGQYVTAEDVGMSEQDMVRIAAHTTHVTGLPVQGEHSAGGDPSPFTAMGIYLGLAAAVQHRLGREDLAGVHVVIQGTGSVGGRLARLLARDGARLTLGDVDAKRAQALAAELGAEAVSADRIMSVPCDVFSPNALGAILDDHGIEQLRTQIVAGGANNQLARPEHGRILEENGVLYTPDYVLNAGGIISVAIEYLARQDGRIAEREEVVGRIEQIPNRLREIWSESESTGRTPSAVADAMARARLGRA
ncbi:Glu/Leu/Phe/Val dehydrogenase dimerization domain-containing protein [Croceicoccus sp. F390]|uniref:Glu/Leu/Phe/Val dehydrogenase dimerization domain-containing protein n=1 Tax=Croceicoccus esteveae TaxID=3075597 RepID=A0ABU2ZIZ7_9SPHN|nr:Glu/Leu/Phe/Val dehydrogenase dimerization domain-containing protein [Croceicoccus sp. F390]MDT0576580.1 Glu/Leu/Phe/Val dehydrogenase dimerization domain-containing protein [Croceicoccus sp. F390]